MRMSKKGRRASAISVAGQASPSPRSIFCDSCTVSPEVNWLAMQRVINSVLFSCASMTRASGPGARKVNNLLSPAGRPAPSRRPPRAEVDLDAFIIYHEFAAKVHILV